LTQDENHAILLVKVSFFLVLNFFDVLKSELHLVAIPDLNEEVGVLLLSGYFPKKGSKNDPLLCE